ncbi:growth/differentiation factor 10b [Colossoma macropomum]|uniref:growth/differentiation factor 10b n=1 Tax=Colossoma macropomum TaxID=42526 RepID=UPI0018643C1A|nr:growth/differentiation factor 10b [Colossoma macropomum]
MALIFVSLVHAVLLMDVVTVNLVDSSKQETADGEERDMVEINMFKMYEKFSKEPHRHREENTVRSFRAASASSNNKVLFYVNLTSIPESEVILSASLHFLDQHIRQRPWSCRRPRGPSCRSQHLQSSPPVQLILRGTSASMSVLGNITLPLLRKGPWQMIDVSSVVQQAHARSDLLISVEFYSGERHQWRHPSLPYVLVYANDLAITEPNSIAMSLQRYGPYPVGEGRGTRPPFATPSSRIRRNAEDLQNNFLPDVQYHDLKHKDLWYSTYFALKPKASPKSHGHEVKNEGSASQELSFDERTMKKARRKQWSEPRVCARRYLRVDFADIGWSEWILAPKAFDAYYCAGTCGFPMPKVVHPSNHATIQSIVRAVGIVPGVPEPCCVPEKMSPLAVLFLDTSRNMVLKVYPSMSVDTCACR